MQNKSIYSTFSIHNIMYYLALLVSAFILSIFLNFPDWDLWARLAVGSLFFQTGTVLKHDIFTYAPQKEVWIDHEWGSGALFFFIMENFGDWGLIFLKVLILFLILFFIGETIKLYIGKDTNISVLFPVIIGFSILPGVQNLIRSHLFTFLFFALWLYVLERVRRGETRLLWIIPATMVIWANMHGGFVAGIGLLVIYTVGNLFNNNKSPKYLITLIITILATLINPYGIEYWNYIIHATTMARPLVPEWQPLSLERPINRFGPVYVHAHLGFMIFALLTAIVAIKLLFEGKKTDWIKIILAFVTFYLGMKHQRHVFFFVVVAGSLFYAHYAALFAYLTDIAKTKLGEKLSLFISRIKQSTIYIIVIVIGCFAVYTVYMSPARFIVSPSIYPIGSLEFIKQNKLSGNLAVTYNWGSYALWKLFPQNLVFTDGRCEEVYSDDIIHLSAIFSEHLDNNWLRIAERFNSDILLLPKRTYPITELTRLDNWKIVYEDALSVVLLPKDKVRDNFITPNPNNPVYLKEDLAKHVNLN